MNKQILLYSTGNYDQYPVTNYSGKRIWGPGRRNEHVLVNQLRKKKKEGGAPGIPQAEHQVLIAKIQNPEKVSSQK